MLGKRRWVPLALAVLGCGAHNTSGAASAPSQVSSSNSPALLPQRDGKGARRTKPPVIAVGGDGQVLVDGRQISVLPPGRVARVDALLELLKARWQEQGPDFSLTGFPLVISPGIDGARAKSLFLTAAFAGWPVAELKTSDGIVFVDSIVPQAPERRTDIPFPQDTLVFVVRRSSFELLHVSHPDDRLYAKGAEADRDTATAENGVSLPHDNIAGGLPPLLEMSCKSKGDCSYSLLYVEQGADFSVALRALGALARNATARGDAPFVQLRREEPDAPGAVLKVHMGATKLSGRLPPELIQKIVRASYGKLRACYEAGLGRDAKLEGKVMIRFVIGRDGKVSQAGTGPGNAMSDQQVTDCVVKHFTELVFPAPDGGIVTVVYPIMFSPG